MPKGLCGVGQRVASRLSRFVGGLIATAFLGLAVPLHAEAPAAGTLEVHDTSRTDLLGKSTFREWSIHVYPEAGSRRHYAPDAVLAAALADQGYYDLGKPEILKWTHDRAVRFSRLALGVRHPLILLLPGQGTAAFNYTHLASALVRKGYKVAVVDLPYLGVSRTADNVIRRAADDPIAESEDGAVWAPRVKDWTTDVSMSLDALQQSPLGRDVDFSHVYAVGHSLGGAVALDACKQDVRIMACADFEGAPFGTNVEAEGPAKPTLFVLSRSLKPDRPFEKPDPSNPMFAFLAKGSAQNVWAVAVGGGSHMSFSDAPIVMPMTLSKFGGTLMTPQRSMTVYATLVDDFIRAVDQPAASDFGTAVRQLPEVRATRIR